LQLQFVAVRYQTNIIRLYRRQTILTDVGGVCLSVCLSRGLNQRWRVPCVCYHSVHLLPNYLPLLFLTPLQQRTAATDDSRHLSVCRSHTFTVQIRLDGSGSSSGQRFPGDPATLYQTGVAQITRPRIVRSSGNLHDEAYEGPRCMVAVKVGAGSRIPPTV